MILRGVQPGRPEWPQAVVKAEIIAEALALGGIDAMVPGPRDWALGLEKVLALQQAHDLPYLAANLECEGRRPFPASKVVERGGHTVGIVGFTAGEVPGCTVEPASEAAPQALAAVSQADVTVALLPLPTRALYDWGQADLEVDLVVDGGTGHALITPEELGRAWKIGVGARGHILGIAPLHFTPGSDQWVPDDISDRLDRQIARWEKRHSLALEMAEDGSAARKERWKEQAAWYREKIDGGRALKEELAEGTAANRFGYEPIRIEPSTADHAATAALLEVGKVRIAEAEGPMKPLDLSTRRVSVGSPFAGSDACVSCHAEQHAQWLETPHSSAWATLGESKRSLDRQCVECHVTGWGAPGGP
ncbi:MAG: hypothetical protein JRI25_05385, partial [Deltaproteobacteria bacterium]|nr:hypothetical protein [Deltaproteobacteria bacterium]